MPFFNRRPKAPSPTMTPLAEMPKGGNEIVLDDVEQAAASRAWSRDRRDLSRSTSDYQSVFADMGVDLLNLPGMAELDRLRAMVDGSTSVGEARLRCGDYHGAASSAMKALAMRFVLEHAMEEQGARQLDWGLIEVDLLARIHEEREDYPRAIGYLDTLRTVVNKSRMPGIKEGWIPLIDHRRSRLIAEHGRKNATKSDAAIDFDDFVFAARFATPTHVKRYLDADLSAETADGQGLFPLHEAAKVGRISILELFLLSGCYVDSKDGFGRSALHCAAMEGQLETATFLLGKGADVTLLDDQGKTPMDHAEESGHSAIADTLRN